MFKKSVIEKIKKKPGVSQQLKQIYLTVEELDADVTTVLTTFNPYFNESRVEYNYKNRAYTPLQTQNKSIFFYEQRGKIVLTDSKVEDEEEEEKNEESVEELDTKRKNKFNYCNRATQTANPLFRDKGVVTEVSPQLVFEANASLASIVSAYAKKEASISAANEETETIDGRKYIKRNEKAINFAQHRRFLRLCERMVDQNLLSDVNIDYSFYDTPSDEFKEKGLGSLLVLWKFSYQPMKKIAVTGLSWNRLYPDMFATSYGSYDVAAKGHIGCICIFTLKCPSFPEKVITCQSGVFCVEFSTICPHLLAAGFADGTVAVYDVRKDDSIPCATNKNARLEHIDIVYQVRWQADNVDGQHNFCSISADNRVINWLLAKTELIPSEIINLQQGEEVTISDANLTAPNSHGTCISFHPSLEDFFLVGTESGLILKCSNSSIAHSFTDHTNAVYAVHWNPYHPRVFISCSADWTIRIWDHTLIESVFTFDLLNEVKDVSWAPFSSTLFAAVTNDGKATIEVSSLKNVILDKLALKRSRCITIRSQLKNYMVNPLYLRDIEHGQTDWQINRFHKHFSTILERAEKVHIFDVMMNKLQPTSTYLIYSAKKNTNLTSVQFNPTKPVIIIGDDRGCVISFKLSPNLRSSLKAFETMEPAKFADAERDKLEKILKLSRNPENVEILKR